MVFVLLLCFAVEASLPVAVIVLPVDSAAAEAEVAEDPLMKVEPEAADLVTVAVGLDELVLVVSDFTVDEAGPKLFR